MIVERLPECCKVAETVGDGLVAPENFSREGALIRRSEVRLAVPMLDRDGDLSSSRQGHRRKAGSSAVASAAYRSASRLRDERIDRV